MQAGCPLGAQPRFKSRPSPQTLAPFPKLSRERWRFSEAFEKWELSPPVPVRGPRHSLSHLLGSGVPCPPSHLPQKTGRTIQVNRKRSSWQVNCPEVSSQAHHPRYKQNHPVTTGSLDYREGKTRAENVLPQADGIRRRAPGLDCTPCSRKTGDSHMTSSTEGDYVASAGL